MIIKFMDRVSSDNLGIGKIVCKYCILQSLPQLLLFLPTKVKVLLALTKTT